LVVRRIAAPEDLLALLAERDARAVFLDVGERAHMAHCVGDRGEWFQLAERVLGRVNELDLAARRALERFSRREPERVHGFRRIVKAFLPGWRGGDEEARIETPCPARRRHPMADVAELACRQVKVLGFQEL